MLRPGSTVADGLAWSFPTAFSMTPARHLASPSASPMRMLRSLSLLFAWLCLLLLALGTRPVLAGDTTQCAPADKFFTVASGASHLIDLSHCSVFGLIDNNPTPAHGTITGLDYNGNGLATYTNNGDGATSDFFTLLDDMGEEVRFTVTITPSTSPIAVSPAVLTTPAIGVPFNTQLSASGGVAPYTYSTTDTLPAGLSLAANGVISGTPTASDSFDFDVKVTDSTPGTPLTTTKRYSVTIAYATLTLAPETTQGVVSQAYNHQFSTSGGTAPYTYMVESGSLPPGTAVSPSGLMSGTPTATGDYSFVLKATDQTGGHGPYSITRPFTVKITAAPQPPVAGPGTATLSANSTANGITLVLSGGVPSSVAVATAASNGVATASGTTISYTPNAGFAGSDSFTYTATNTAGTSSPATVTITVNPVAPLAPAIGAATAGNGQASVSFTAPSNNGGSPITGYTVTSTPGNFTGTGNISPITVSGLANGTAYTFTATATNAVGTSSPSAASSSITPRAAPVISAVSPNRGMTTGGTSVTITGSGFMTTTNVKFGGTSATGITVVSDTQITATSPAGTGVVDITVVTPGGTSATGIADRFTYIAAPVVSSLSPTSGPNSGGTTVTISGSDFSGATAVRFGAANATGFSINSPSQITAIAPAGVGTIDVRVTTAGGTSSTSVADQFTYVGAPAITGISPRSGPLGGGNSVTISGTNLSGALAVKFGATNATGFTVNSASQITATAPAGMGSGTVDITVTTASGTSATSAADQYTYAAIPALSSLSPTSGPGSGGTSVVITGSNLSGAMAVTFGASAATAFTVNSNTQITATAPAGTGTVAVTVTTGAGTSAANPTGQFTYIAAPMVSGISPNTGPLVGGTSVTITGTNLSGAMAVRFGSAAATGYTINSATQITATAPAGTGTVDITVITSGGISATSAADKYTYADVAVGPVTATVPYGSSSTSIALDFKGGTPTSVAVDSNPAHGTATASGTGISYTPTAGFAGTDTFTYTATTAGVTSSPATVSITVSPPTQTVTAAGSWAATRGQFYTQTLTWSGGAAPYSNYTVLGLPSGLSVSNPTANSISISGTPLQAGSYAITFSARDNSTGDGPFTQPATFTLTVNAASALTLTPGAGTFTATSGNPFSQAFSASGGLAPYTLVQNGTLPAGVSWNAATATLAGTPTESGDFAFTLTASDSSGGAPETTTQSYVLKVANSVPVAPTLSVNGAGPGEPVVVNLTSNATGAPFTGASLISMVPANAGTATISAVGAGTARMRAFAATPGNNYSLRFVPNPDASGLVTLTYTLSNATSTSSPGVITISLSSRSDPSKDAEVQGLINAQANSSRRFASGQISNFQQRLEALHGGNVSTFSNGFTLTSASLQRQRQRQSLNDDPTGIEQWMQIQSAKLQSEQSLRLNPTTKPTQALGLKPLNDLAPELGNQSADAANSPLAFWTSGTISIGDDSTGKSSQSQDFVTSGLSVGADYRLAPNLTVGLGLGYGHDKTDIGDNGSRSQADSYSLALYGSYRPFENVYLDGVLGYQRLTFDNRRYVTDNAGMVKGDRDGSQTFLSLAASYEYRQENWLLSPYARLDLAHATLDKYRERGDDLFALSYDEQTVKTTSTSLGLRSEYAQAMPFGILTPSLRVEYQHDFQGAGDAAMRYADVVGDGALYHVKLDALGQDRGVFGLGLGLLTESSFSLNVEYQYTLSSGAQRAQSMLFNLRKPF